MRAFALLLSSLLLVGCTPSSDHRSASDSASDGSHRDDDDSDSESDSDSDSDSDCPPPVATPDGLVGAWNFEESDGQIAYDSTPNANDGLLGGNTAADSRDPIRQLHPAGRHVRFSGNQFIQVGRDAVLEPAHVSVEAWVQWSLDPAAPPYYEYVVGKGVKDCYAASYSLVTSANWGLVFHLSENGSAGWRQSPDAGPGIWDGQWHHVVGTFDGSTARLYVDGSEIGSGTPVPFAIGYETPQDGSLYIGDYSPTAPCGNAFRGSIDDVRIWNRALPSDEVATLLD